MKDLLKNKKKSLEYDLEQQKVNEADAEEAQEVAKKALNDYMRGREAYYEQEKVKINAKLELIEELLAY